MSFGAGASGSGPKGRLVGKRYISQVECGCGCVCAISGHPRLATGGAEAPGAAGSLGQGVGFSKDGLNALDDAELGDAVAGGNCLGLGREVGEDDFEFTAIAGIDDTGEGREAAQGETGAVFDEGAVSFGKFQCKPRGNRTGGAGFAHGRKYGGFRGEEIGGKVSIRTRVSVAGQLRGGVEALHENRGLRTGVRHGVKKIVAWRERKASS